MNGSTLQPDEGGRCPVCQARFRGLATCSRCHADLMSLMLVSAHAYSRRQAARRLLEAGEAQEALSAAEAAERLHATRQGSILQMVCAAAVAAKGGRADAALPVRKGTILTNRKVQGPFRLKATLPEKVERPSGKHLRSQARFSLWKTLGLSAAVLVMAASAIYWRRE